MALKFSIVRDLIVRNWGLKLLSILVAAVSYYAIRGATGYEVEYSVPLQVEVEAGMAVLEQNVSSVTVRFRGSQDDLLKLHQEHIRAIVRPKVADPDGLPKSLPVGPRDITGAPRVTVVDVEPASVVLTFDREVETVFSVAKPKTIGRPLVGNVEIDYEPKTVVLRGPKRRLEDLKREGRDAVTTEPVDVDGRVESFVRNVAVRPPGSTWVSHIEPPEISVTVNIVTKVTSQQWDELPVLAIRDPRLVRDIVFDPSVVDVTLEGRSEMLENLTKDDIRVFVDCVGLDPAQSYELPVQAHLPVFLDVNVSVVPKTVRVSFAALDAAAEN